MEGTSTSTGSDTTIDLLNSFLRGEISAVETYRQAMEKLSKSRHLQQLAECRRSHEYRAGLLRQRITELGGTPSEDSGAWGAFAKLVQGGANLFGEKAAIAALEEGEDHGRDDYKRDLEKLDPQAREFVRARILPDQERTHATLSSLKQTLQ